MDSYIAHFFGALTIQYREKNLDLPQSSTARSLLAYLLYHHTQTHTRSKLAGIFWPASSEARARRSLSQALWQIRKILPDIIQANSDEIVILTGVPIHLDVEDFEIKISTSDGKLRQAVSLYRGEFLENQTEDWIFPERQRLRGLYIQGLEKLIHFDKSGGHYQDALAHALSLTKVDPYRDSAHAEVMRLLFSLNQPREALAHYKTYLEALLNEPGLEPGPDTVLLAREITRKTIPDQNAHLPEIIPINNQIPLDRQLQMQIPLIGRKDERYHLLETLETIFDVEYPKGGIVILEGEAGVGKSRLVEEVARDLEWRGGQVLWGRGSQMEITPPYGPVVNAISNGISSLRVNQISQVIDSIWLQVILTLIPGLSKYLPQLHPAHSAHPDQEQARLSEAIIQFMLAWAQFTPTVLILEDLQWADTATLELLQKLTVRLENSSMAILATHRGEEVRTYPVLWEKLEAIDRAGLKGRLILDRLNDQHTGELIRFSLGMVQAAPIFEKRLFQETEGNPLFILETLRSLYDDELLKRDNTGTWSTPWDESTVDYVELPLPHAVTKVIQRRLSRLTPEQKHLLEIAAVLGSEFDYVLLSKSAKLDSSRQISIVRELVRRHFIDETPDVYRFGHDKIRQAVFDGITDENLTNYHIQVGQAIEQNQPDRVSDLATHFFDGKDWSRAARYGQLAGDQAARVYANQIAADHYTRALAALAETGGEKAADIKFELILSREKVFRLMGNRDAEFNDLQALESLIREAQLDIPKYKIALLLHKVYYYEAISDFSMALELAQETAQLTEAENDFQTAYLTHIQWGRILKQQGKFNQAQTHFQIAHELAKTMEDCAKQADSLGEIGVIFFEQGNYDAAQDYYQQALAICGTIENKDVTAKIHTKIGNIYHYLADYPAALEYGHKSLRVWREFGYNKMIARCLYNLAAVYSDSGDHQTARNYLEQVCKIANAMSESVLEGYGWVFLGLVLEHLGEFSFAIDAYEKGLSLRRSVGLDAMTNDPLAGLARVKTSQGKHIEAVKYATQVLDWIAENGHEGIGDPLLAYVGAYQTLLAAGEEGRGLTALQEAFTLLMKFANSISDPERRRAYIHDISPGKPIWVDYHTYIAKDSYRQILVRLPRTDAPTGRPIQEAEWIALQWTVIAPEDETISGKADRRQTRLLRLLKEAETQGAAATVNALAQALGTSARTIKRDLAVLRDAGHTVQTRGSREV